MDTHVALQRSQTLHLRNEGAAAWSQIAQQRFTHQQARLVHIPETAVPQTKAADLARFQRQSQSLPSHAAELSEVVGPRPLMLRVTRLMGSSPEKRLLGSAMQ